MTDLYNRYVQLKATNTQGDVREWVNIDLEFDGEQNYSEGINESSIKIFNLNEDSRAFITAKNTTVELIAGYTSVNGRIVIGTVEEATDAYNAPDRITEVTVREGAVNAREIKFKKSYKKGTSYRVVIEDLLKALTAKPKSGVPALNRGEINLNAVTKTIDDVKKTKTIKGEAFKALTKLCKSFGLLVQITNNTISINPSEFQLGQEVIRLDAESGLIGKPEQTEDGLKVKSLLRSAYRPGAVIDLFSNGYKGLYKIVNLKFSGGTRSQSPFMHELELEVYKG